MLYEIVYGDITKLDVEAIVVPESVSEPEPCEITKNIYKAAGFRNLANEYFVKINKPRTPVVLEDDEIDYEQIGIMAAQAELHSTITVTKGYGLKAKYAIHLDVREIIEEWDEGQFATDYYKNQSVIYNCYADALDSAEKLGVHSVAFPLIGACVLGFQEDYARLIAEYAIAVHPDCLLDDGELMTAYLVIPYKKPLENEKPNDLYSDADCFVQYERTLSEKVNNSGLRRDEFFKETCYDYLNRIENDSKLADILNINSGVISRFRSAQSKTGSGSVPRNRKRIIGMAIAMGLSDYERFEFIRCTGNEYPAEKLDYQVEKIIRSGIASFAKINEELCRINPAYDLTDSSNKSAKEK